MSQPVEGAHDRWVALGYCPSLSPASAAWCNLRVGHSGLHTAAVHPSPENSDTRVWWSA